MLTRYTGQVFQAEGRHLLCTTAVALGIAGGKVSGGYATLSAVVRAGALEASTTTDGSSRDTSVSPSGRDGTMYDADTQG